MAIISQPSLFSWKNIEAKSDLKRLELVLSCLPDEALMRELEEDRGFGRNDYPIRSLWNSLIAGIVYGHLSIESLRRELKRNGELRELCGFDVFAGASAIPESYVYTRFLKKLLSKESRIEEMFNKQVAEIGNLLEDFGEELAIDSKAIKSYARRKTYKNESDGRRDLDGDYGCKTYRGLDKKGRLWEKVTKWFGYKVHLLVDSCYELPIGYEVTKASQSDMNELLPMLDKASQRHKEILDRSRYLSADKGYDSAENNWGLYQNYGIKPVIDIRSMWREKEERPLYPDAIRETAYYDETGKVYCLNPVSSNAKNSRREMAYVGYEKDRMSLKYRCPAKAYGFKCLWQKSCPGAEGKYGKVVRIKLKEDNRIFVPLARSSYEWKRAYKKRTAVERVNSRLDVSYGFEQHTIRGLKKMKVRMGLSLVVMLSMALGHIRAGRKDQMRSLVKLPMAA